MVDDIKYTPFCTDTEISQNEIGANIVQYGSAGVGLVVGILGAGVTSPLAGGIAAGGSVLAEGIRAKCTDQSFEEMGKQTMLEAGSIAMRTGASFIPLGGVAGDVVVAGITSVYDVATRNIPVTPRSYANEPTAITRGPRQLFPESIRTQVAEAFPETAITQQYDADPAKGHGLHSTGKSSGPTAGELY